MKIVQSLADKTCYGFYQRSGKCVCIVQMSEPNDVLLKQMSASLALLSACEAHQAVGDHVEMCPQCGDGASCTEYNGLARKADELTKAALAQVEEAE